jgi:hypothetical protein
MGAAIEIDPAIAFLGTKYHPERPYDDPRVNLSINDARNFFRTANQQYDLIVYGVLDSHTALSHASNLRVDSYVGDGIQFDVFRICISLSAGIGILFSRLGVFTEVHIARSNGQAAPVRP